MQKKMIMVAVLALLGGAGAQAAPQPIYELKGITVTATRQAETTKDVPAYVQVVTEKEIKSKNIQNAAQALSTVTAVQVDNSVEGNLNLRGYDSKNVLVLVDGSQVNSAWNGSVDWNMIPVENIRKIEVVNGGQSALYGGRAVGGVINIITKTPKAEGTHGSVFIGYGSHRTVKQSYDISGKKEKLTYGIHYERKDTDGWRSFLSAVAKKKKVKGKEIDNFKGIDTSYLDTNANGKKYIVGDRGTKFVHSYSVGIRLGYHLDAAERLMYNYTHSDYDWGYKDPATYMKDGKWKATGATAFGNRGYRVYDVHSLTYNNQKDKIHAHWGMTDYTKDGALSPGRKAKKDSGVGNKTSYPSTTWNFDINKRWNVGNHTILFGTTYGKENMECRYDAQVADWTQWGSAVTKSDEDCISGGKTTMAAFYLQDKWQVNDKTNLYIGGRYDNYKKHDGYTISNDKKDGIKEESYHRFSPKLSLIYEEDKNSSIYVSFGKSFAPPLMYQLFRYSNRFGNTYLPNPGLKPEITTNYELGWKKTLGATQVNADIFFAKTHDYIDLVEVKDKKKTKTYENIGTADTKGMEIAVTHRLNKIWSAYANYTYQTGDIDESGSGKSVTNYSIPKHLIHAGVIYDNSPWNINLDGSFISSRNKPGEVGGKFESKDAYFLLNLVTNYRVNDQFSCQLAVQNLFNRKYFDQEAGSDRYYVGDGRAVTLSARYVF